MADLSHTALIVVDTQLGVFDDPFPRSNPSFESNITTLLRFFRSFPPGPTAPHIIHIHHHSVEPLSALHPSSPRVESHPCALPIGDEPIFRKSTSSAFVTPELGEYLKGKQIWRLYFVGLVVDQCVNSTVRSACDLGIGDHVDSAEKVNGDIVVVDDAVAAWEKEGGKWNAETVHAVHVESLKGEFARVVKTSDVLTEVGGRA